MKNIFRFYTRPRRTRAERLLGSRPHKAIAAGWVVKTQWRSKIRFKRFWDHIEGGEVQAFGAAIDWLTRSNKELGKPHDIRRIRSSGAYASRSGKRGTWHR